MHLSDLSFFVHPSSQATHNLSTLKPSKSAPTMIRSLNSTALRVKDLLSINDIDYNNTKEASAKLGTHRKSNVI